MTHQTETSSALHRRSRRSLARELVVAALCALIVVGFVLDVALGARPGRPASAQAAAALTT